MESKYTPGKWVALPPSLRGTKVIVAHVPASDVRAEHTAVIASCENYPDAKIMAASKELLEALQACERLLLTQFDPASTTLEKARAAIERATK